MYIWYDEDITERFCGLIFPILFYLFIYLCIHVFIYLFTSDLCFTPWFLNWEIWGAQVCDFIYLS
jgi:hypothetical protein